MKIFATGFFVCLPILWSGVVFAFKEKVGDGTSLRSEASRLMQKTFSKNMELGGSANLNFSTYGGMALRVAPSAKYFITDKLALGGTVSYFASESNNYLGLGPSAAFYFWKKQRWAIFYEQTVIFRFYRTSDPPFMYGSSILGIHYFLVPSVALGFKPGIEYPLGDPKGEVSISLLNVSFSFFF